MPDESDVAATNAVTDSESLEDLSLASEGINPSVIRRGCQCPAANYVAVVYFHGMGSQRRFEETSRLIESLDAASNDGTRFLFDISCHVEPSQVMPGEMIQYIRTVHPRLRSKLNQSPTAPRTCHLVHFYEGYWAPITAGEVGAGTVFWWLMRQMLRPYTMLLGSWSDTASLLKHDPALRQAAANQSGKSTETAKSKLALPVWDWRGHSRLRRTALRELEVWHRSLGDRRSLWESPQTSAPADRSQAKAKAIRMQPGDLRLILRAYRLFEGPESRRNHLAGSFSEFREFLIDVLKRRLPAEDSGHTRIPLIADAWKRYMVLTEIRNAAVLTSIVLAIALSIFGSLQVASIVLGIVPIKSWLGIDWNPATVTGILATLFGLPLFLTRYLGDVVFWCTYEETDVRFKKRKEILDYGVKVLKHVLKDTNCQRVVVIAHSLGTAIAHDVLLEFGKQDWARDHNNNDAFESCNVDLVSTDEINKIEHFITAGSPIDKIHYFFESDPGRSHRYTRVSETIRGDMGRKPFGNNNNSPFLHWINFWDKADVISGSLESPPNATDIDVCVDNVEVSNGVWNPLAAHTSYFRNEKVLSYLLKIIYENQFSYRVLRDPAAVATRARNYRAENIGAGSGNTYIRWIQMAVLTIPWIALAIIVWHFLSHRQ